MLSSLQTRIILHSHAQQDWTEIKVKKLKKFGNIAGFLATPLESKKDKVSWVTALEMSEISHWDNTLVVGDNLESDIKTAIEAGAKHLVWVSHGNSIPDDFLIPPDVNLIIINNISDLI